jgi:hypothetical protein
MQTTIDPELKKQIDEMVKMRDAALESLDETKILDYMKKYNVPIPPNKHVFWIAVHKSILMSNLPILIKMRSHNWLKERGYDTSVKRMLIQAGIEEE